jgi:hypothetical protein
MPTAQSCYQLQVLPLATGVAECANACSVTFAEASDITDHVLSIRALRSFFVIPAVGIGGRMLTIL